MAKPRAALSARWLKNLGLQGQPGGRPSRHREYTRMTDRSLLEGTYQTYRKALRLVPRTTDVGVRNILDAIADQNPKARSANPQDFYTNRFIDELEQTGFMRELAARYPEALR